MAEHKNFGKEQESALLLEAHRGITPSNALPTQQQRDTGRLSIQPDARQTLNAPRQRQVVAETPSRPRL